MPERAGPLALVALVGLVAVWGTQFLVIKHGLGGVPPLLAAGLRFLVVAAVAQAVVTARRLSPPPGERVARLAFGLAQSVAFGALYWAQARLPTAVAGALASTSPLFVLVLAPLVAGEPLRAARAVGVGVGFAGAVLVAGAAGATEGVVAVVPVAVLLGGELAGALNKTLSKRLSATAPIAVMLRDLGAVAGVALVAASLGFEPAPVWSATGVAAFVYLGLVASLGGSALYLALVRRFPISTLGYLPFLTGTVAVLLGLLVAGEALPPAMLAGALLILAGVVALARPQRRLPTDGAKRPR